MFLSTGFSERPSETSGQPHSSKVSATCRWTRVSPYCSLYYLLNTLKLRNTHRKCKTHQWHEPSRPIKRYHAEINLILPLGTLVTPADGPEPVEKPHRVESSHAFVGTRRNASIRFRHLCKRCIGLKPTAPASVPNRGRQSGWLDVTFVLCDVHTIIYTGYNVPNLKLLSTYIPAFCRCSW